MRTEVSIGTYVDRDRDGAPDTCDSTCESLGMLADEDDDGDGVLDVDDQFPAISLNRLEVVQLGVLTYRITTNYRISADGLTLVFGHTGEDTMGQNAGAVLVFRYVDGAWDQMGETIFGSSASDNAGRGIAISDDGQKLAVGFPGEATWRGEDYGVVRIYAWDGSSWVQQGSDIYQPSNRSMLNAFGWSIDFNDAGTGVVVSADNYAVIYEFDGTDWAEHSQQLSARRAYVEWRGDHLVTGEDYLYRVEARTGSVCPVVTVRIHWR